MKKFSKIMIILIVVLLIASIFVACNPEPTPEPDPVPDPEPTPGPDPAPDPDPDEWTLEREEGYNQITFYWDGKADVETCDVWVWWDGKEGSGYLMHECNYGMKAMINVPEGIEQVGFIVRKNCSDPGGNSWGEATKDFETDRFAIIKASDTVIYLKEGDGSQYTSNDNGATLEMIKDFTIASMISMNTVFYTVTPAYKITSLDDVKLYQGDKLVEIEKVSSLNNKVTSGRITVSGQLDITKEYTLEIGDFGKKVVVPTTIFDSKDFIDNYVYDGDDLGAIVADGQTTFKVWAPTASKVVLNLFDSGHEGVAYKSVDMVKADKGVWEKVENGSLYGKYYTYSVTTAVGTQEAVDPYAKSAGLNGNRGMIIDLDATDPTGFSQDTYIDSIEKYTDAVIWEVHVRDFTNKIATAKYPGKYLGFTETGLTNSSGVPVGIDYVKNLGATHVHLLPVYDYATVNEADPDSQFNWGYDPKNYNVPEGSYSTNPYDGAVRVTEFKQMVQAMHAQGLGVVMDVVYNHTYDGNSSLNKIVPYYYYRYTSSGANSNGSGCGNDTASERYMYRKFMVDSCAYWMREYHLDGFRFDLMGLHDTVTMQAIEKAVHEINPNAIIYGEGWTMGDNRYSKDPAANQTNIDKVIKQDGAAGSVAVFNDAIRDGIKGSVFDEKSQGYVSGAANSDNLNKVKFGIMGGSSSLGSVTWHVNNAAVINYVSAHDNNTLWDKLAISNEKDSIEDRLAMNRLAAAIYMVSQGTPFMQAGEEMLRTKYDETTGTYDHNSYKSSDEINNIDWESLQIGSNEYNMMLYYQGLIAMRKELAVLRTNGSATITFQTLQDNALAVKFNDGDTTVIVLINPKPITIKYNLTGEWDIYAEGTQAGATVLGQASGQYVLEGRSVTVLKSK